MEVEDGGFNAETNKTFSDVDNDKAVDSSIELQQKDLPTTAPKGMNFLLFG